MAPYRRYDYGLRGARDTQPDRFRGADRGSDYERGYDFGYGAYAPRPNRVTARYNMDYVRGNREQYPRNYNFYTGDRMDRMGDERWYRRPYMTRAGTRTLRGASYPTGYDFPDYGPNYGGRYRDEL